MMTKRLSGLAALAMVTVLIVACSTIQPAQPVTTSRPAPSSASAASSTAQAPTTTTTTTAPATTNGPTLVDNEGQPIPTVQARTIVAVYQALTNGDLDTLHRLYDGTGSRWSDQERLLSQQSIRIKIRHALTTHPAPEQGYSYPGFVTSGWHTAVDRADGRKLHVDPNAMAHPQTQFTGVAYTTDFHASAGSETLAWEGIHGPELNEDSSVSPAGGTDGSLDSFVGEWIGHERTLRVSTSGTATESINSGCCERVIDLTMRLSSPRGSTVSATVVAVSVHAWWNPNKQPPRVGQTGTFAVDHGVLTDSLTDTPYCTEAEQMHGTCGA